MGDNEFIAIIKDINRVFYREMEESLCCMYIIFLSITEKK